MTADAVAVRAGALGVGAEQGRLHASWPSRTPCGSGRAARCRSPELLRRELRIDPWSTDTTPSRPAHRAADQRALARARDAGDDDEHNPAVCRRRWRAGCCAVRAADLEHARRTYAPTRLQRRAVLEVPAGDGATPPQLPQRCPRRPRSPPACAARRPGRGPRRARRSRSSSGSCSTTSTVLPLSRRLQQQLVHAAGCRAGCRPDRRLVENVGDIGERRAELPDHLDALRLAAGQRARRRGPGDR